MTTAVEASCYVFGIVAAGTPVPAIAGTGPADGLRLVTVDALAAVVGTPPSARPLGRAADLLAHDEVLAAFVASGTTVLPLQFGAVVVDETAVVDELLTARYDELRAELDRIDGCVQYTVKMRYDRDVVLREVVASHPEIARLRASADSGGAASLDHSVRLGELVVRALEELRSTDAGALLAELGEIAERRVHEPTSPEDVLHAAVLVDRRRLAAFESAVEDLARRHHPRVHVRLVGPSPAYDFVGGR